MTLLRHPHKGLTVAWLILVVATLVGWALSETGHNVTGGLPLATAGVIVTGFIKVWLVGFEFMELRHAPRWLRHGFDLWVVIVSLALIILALGVYPTAPVSP